MSLWKTLFGGSKSSVGAAPVRSVEHKGFIIEARPFAASGQYQVAGTIAREIDGARREHRFVRADRCTTIEEAADMALAKGRLIVEQQGEGMFGSA